MPEWFVNDRLEPVNFSSHPLRPVFNRCKAKTEEVRRGASLEKSSNPALPFKRPLSRPHPPCLSLLQEDRVRYATRVTKLDRASFKTRSYVLVVTTKAMYVLFPDTLKLNTRVDFQDLLVGHNNCSALSLSCLCFISCSFAGIERE